MVKFPFEKANSIVAMVKSVRMPGSVFGIVANIVGAVTLNHEHAYVYHYTFTIVIISACLQTSLTLFNIIKRLHNETQRPCTKVLEMHDLILLATNNSMKYYVVNDRIIIIQLHLWFYNRKTSMGYTLHMGLLSFPPCSHSSHSNNLADFMTCVFYFDQSFLIQIPELLYTLLSRFPLWIRSFHYCSIFTTIFYGLPK